jgi:hypothetical protein
MRWSNGDWVFAWGVELECWKEPLENPTAPEESLDTVVETVATSNSTSKEVWERKEGISPNVRVKGKTINIMHLKQGTQTLNTPC